MKDARKTKAQLVAELEAARARIEALESALGHPYGPRGETAAPYARESTTPWPSRRAPAAFEGLFNVSERKNAEELLRALVDTLPVDFWAMDSEGRYVMQNAANRAHWGELTGRRLEDVPLSPEMRGLWAAQDQRAMAGEVVEEEYEVAEGGESRVFCKTIAPVWRAGRVVGIVCLAFDITDRVRLEKEMLRVSEREQRRIGQDLHDNLGQQLAGILCLARGLANELSSERSPKAAAAAEIADLVKGALGLTHTMIRGLRPTGLDSGGLLPGLEELASATEKLFKIPCSFEAKASVTVANDVVCDHLYRIAQEAATNAVKHGKAQTIQITLGREHGKNVLRIIDDGVGMPGAASRPEGMGLRIMEHRAKMIGGRLAVRTPAEGGTVVACFF